MRHNPALYTASFSFLCLRHLATVDPLTLPAVITSPTGRVKIFFRLSISLTNVMLVIGFSLVNDAPLVAVKL